MYVCHCKVVTSGRITEAIVAGARTTKAVAQATSAGSDCARCVSTIARMVREQAHGARDAEASGGS
jgi:bacterioferritin-associated ferredoxin